MKAVLAVAGESRSCPHCKATILKSAAACPICPHNVRFAAIGAGPVPSKTSCQLLIEGTLTNGAGEAALEYFLLMEVRDASGKVVSRQSVGVGAIPQAAQRTFTLRVETAPA